MKEIKITAYKGFDKDMKCRNFQYEIGKKYEMGSDVEVCKRGFHSCENPMDVLNYYKDMLNDRYCVVEQSGNIDRATDSTKIVSSKIKVKTEIGWEGLFKFGIEWLREITNPENVKTIDNLLNDNDADYAQIGSSDNAAQISSSGDYAQIGSSGDCAHLGSSGDCAHLGSSGDYAKIGSSGDYAQIGSSGDCAHLGSSGNYAQIGSSGDYAQIGSSSGCAQISSSGDYAKIGSSGDYAQIGSSGYCAHLGSSGNYAQIGSSGDYAQIGSSGGCAQISSSGGCARIGSSGDYTYISSGGNYTKIDSTGETSVIMCAGRNSVAKAKVGSWITLSEWKYSEAEGRYIPVCVKAEYVDGDRIKADTWYKLENGEFMEESL